MALLMYLNKERFRPENPLVFDTHLNDDVFMSFVDLIPSVIKRSTTAAMTAGEVEYHSFREIMDLANSWLERNPNWTVFNCETIMLYYKFNDKMSYYELRPNDSNFYIYGSEKNNVLKALRIWIKRKRGRDKQYIDVQTLNYYDILPEQLNEYGKFENLDRIIEKANELLSNKDIQGNLITVESLICECSKTKVEPDITLNVTSAKKMIVLRIFYQENSLTIDSSLGIIDFVPRHLSGGGLFKRPKYEPFDDVLSRAYVWLSENFSVRLVNLKTLDIKIKSWTNIDTKIMHYNEHGCYLRILRLAYARKSGQRAPMLALSSKSLSNDTIITNKNLLKDKNTKNLKSVTFQNSKNKNLSKNVSIENQVVSNKKNENNLNTEHCYIHNEQLKNTIDNALKAIEEAKELESKITHPDEETILANEEEFHKQLSHHKKIAEHANSKCTCNIDTYSDESFESVDNNMNLKNDDEIKKNEKKFTKNRKIYLNSKFFNPIRKNETIQKMQLRIHEFVNSMLTIKNLNNNQNILISGKRNSKRYSIIDGSLVALPKIQNENRRKKMNSKKGGLNDNYLYSNNDNIIDEHSNDVLSSKSINESRKPSFVQNNMQNLLIDQDVHCNVICAETINIFCKSIETNLYEEQNETFQYNRFGTRNGYIIVTFRIYYDNGTNNHILEYQNKMNEQKKAKTLKLSIENNKNGISTKIKQEIVQNIDEQSSDIKKVNNRNFNESMCCII